jgi:hypothetical protein
MLNIDSVEKGLVIDHIKAGKAMEIYHYLNLDKMDAAISGFLNSRPITLVFKFAILLPYISSSLSKTGPSLQTLLFPAFVSMVHPKQAPMPQAILLSKDK